MRGYWEPRDTLTPRVLEHRVAVPSTDGFTSFISARSTTMTIELGRVSVETKARMPNGPDFDPVITTQKPVNFGLFV